MAKLGEGDARWIVAERDDGKNVGHWHWAEKDVLPWAQQTLAASLANLEFAGGAFSTGAEVNVSGEAILNNRKAKLIPSYELEVSGEWARAADGATGAWKFPYVADENAGDEDIELRATVPPGGDAAAAAAFVAAAKPELVARVKEFIKRLAAGGPDADAGKAVKGPAAAAAAPQPTKPAAAAAAPQPTKPAATAKPTTKPSTGTSDAPTTTVTVVEKFYARPADIFDALTSPPRVMAFTQAPAVVEPRPGGAYKLFAGAVDASFVDLHAPDVQHDARIVLDWRFKDWPDGALSRVDISLTEPSEGLTVVTVTHAGVPTVDRHGNGGVADTVEAGWRGQVLGRLRQVFGYGVGL